MARKRGHVTLRGTYPGVEGDFASFGYPLPYPKDVKCSWKIKARGGSVIQLTFHSFHLEAARYLGHCWDDAVSIVQGERGK